MAKKATTVQTIICSKEKFKSEADARSWIKAHGFKTDKVDETEESYRYRQVDPSMMEEGSFRTIEMTDGVKAVVGHKKDGMVQGSEQDRMHIVSNLSISNRSGNRALLHSLTPGTHYRVGAGGKFVPFVVDQAMVERIVFNYHRMQLAYKDRKLPVNIDHGSERVGDIEDMYIEGAELLIHVSLSDKVSIDGYRESSMEIMTRYPDEDGEDQHETPLGVALTNYAIVKGLRPNVALSQNVYDIVNKEEKQGMDFLDKVKLTLGLKDATDEQVITKLSEIVSNVGTITEKLTLATNRVSALEAENVKIKATAAVDALIGDKLLPVQKPEFLELAQANFPMFEKVVKGLPKLNLTQEIGHGQGADETELGDPGAEIRRLAIEKAAKMNIAYDKAEELVFSERPDIAMKYLGR